jgi:putative PIG3 family NAD(P)H quinone oxidoreductase
MKAAVLTDSEGPDALRIKEVADPVPGPTELLVRVRATALNRADLLQTLGLYPPPPDVSQEIPGMEYAGEVVAIGARCRRFKVGEHVMGIVGGGAFAELLICHEREAMRIPTMMSFTDAAAIPEAFITAFDALSLQAGLKASESVLIHAAGSGVGTAAVQIAHALGARVIGTARTADKLTRLKPLGMHHGVLTGGDAPGFARDVKTLTDGAGVDVVLDLVTGDTVAETLNCIAQRARWVLVGMLGGAQVTVDLALLLRKRATLMGTVLRSRPIEEKIFVAQATEKTLLPLFAERKLRPVVDCVYPMANLSEAFARLSSNASFGKIVLEWP